MIYSIPKLKRLNKLILNNNKKRINLLASHKSLKIYSIKEYIRMRFKNKLINLWKQLKIFPKLEIDSDF